jgi:hypothetical protein
MKWFERRNILSGNPEEIWQGYNTELHRKTSEIIMEENDGDEIRTSSSLLQRRLQKIIKISI